MKLIPMTDFVLREQNRLIQASNARLKEFSSQYLDRIFNYANFLKQPLKLEMFVPCDEDGNILNEPKGYLHYEFLKSDYDNLKDSHKSALLTRPDCSEYYKAKQKVLFKNFIKKVGEKHVELLIEQQFITIGIGFKNGIYKTIEDLANNYPILKLTDSATKQFLTK